MILNPLDTKFEEILAGIQFSGAFDDAVISQKMLDLWMDRRVLRSLSEYIEVSQPSHLAAKSEELLTAGWLRQLDDLSRVVNVPRNQPSVDRVTSVSQGHPACVEDVRDRADEIIALVADGAAFEEGGFCDQSLVDMQSELLARVRDFVDSYRPTADTGAATPRFDGSAWHQLADELGLVGLTVPESLGGRGAPLLQMGLVVAELGRALLPVPYLSSAVAATVLARIHGTRPISIVRTFIDEILPDIVTGELIAGFAVTEAHRHPIGKARDNIIEVTGLLQGVLDGPLLDLLLCTVLVEGRPVLCAIRIPSVGVDVVEVTTSGRATPSGDFKLNRAPAIPLTLPSGGGSVALRVGDLMSTATAVEYLGVTARCLTIIVNHLRSASSDSTLLDIRRSLAELSVEFVAARAAIWKALLAAETDLPERTLAAPLAQVLCGELLRRASEEALRIGKSDNAVEIDGIRRYAEYAASLDAPLGGTQLARQLFVERAQLSSCSWLR